MLYQSKIRFFLIKQDQSSVSSYALQFRTLAATCGWNESALITAYRHGLNPEIRLQLAIYDDVVGLENIIQRSIRVDQRHTACMLDTPTPPPPPSGANLPAPEPMDIGSHHLSSSERQRRISSHLCLYCGLSGHQLPTCPIRPPRSVVSTVRLPLPISAIITYLHHSLPVQALIDSGSAGNSIALSTLQRLQTRQRVIPQTLHVQSILGKPLGRGGIGHRSPDITFQIGHLHREEISFMVLDGSTVEIILGCPWLEEHAPNVQWSTGEILQWVKKPSRPSSVSTSSVPLASTSVESPPVDNPLEIPTPYRAFQDVFNKQLATTLPPDRPWDCVIDLLPGAMLPHSKIYPLSIPEQKAMEKYIEEALQQGYIRPSTSPAASSFFFVGKKDGGLRPCIGYRILNQSTVKFRYPLPLVPASLEQIRDAQIFTKLDLRSAYNLIRIRKGDEWKTAFITPAGHYEYLVMPFGLSNSPSVFQGFMNEIFRDVLNRFVITYIDDIRIYSSKLSEHIRHVRFVLQRLRDHHLYLKLEKCEFHQKSIQFLEYVITPQGVTMDQRKVDAVTNWSLPTNIKELQRFLGFANFYRRFIKGFSQICAPITSLLKCWAKSLSWTAQATIAFEEVEEVFQLCSYPRPSGS
ncbi:retrotransposable element [Pimephales promelas]|nr:retrotransposable element [Pimephales promelas]